MTTLFLGTAKNSGNIKMETITAVKACTSSKLTWIFTEVFQGCVDFHMSFQVHVDFHRGHLKVMWIFTEVISRSCWFSQRSFQGHVVCFSQNKCIINRTLSTGLAKTKSENRPDKSPFYIAFIKGKHRFNFGVRVKCHIDLFVGTCMCNGRTELQLNSAGIWWTLPRKHYDAVFFLSEHFF